MRATGIVCEGNPPHAGHRYLIETARENGADAVVCVLSGCFVQRGDAAVLEQHIRARMMLDIGADLVLELPFPYCASGAESFALAGVSILERAGVDEIRFGSECGDLDLLSRYANAVGSEDFATRYAKLCASGTVGTAAAFSQCLLETVGADLLPGPNDRLGIAYLRALSELGASMTPATVARIGDGYSDSSVGSVIPSATALRRLLFEQGADALAPYLPKNSLDFLKAQIQAGQAPASLSNTGRGLLSFFRMADPAKIEEIAGLSGGLGRRMAEAAKQADSLDAMITLAGTKKYPEARIRRGMVFAVTGVKQADLQTEPAYTRLLAANSRGCAFLSEKRKTLEIPIVTSHAGIPSSAAAQAQTEWLRRSYALWSLCLPQPGSETELLRRSPIIVGKF